VTQEDALLDALARMHARFWESPALDLPWLARPIHLGGLLHPDACAPENRPVPSPPVMERAHAGWAVALARLPSGCAALVRRPAEALAEVSASLPRTLLHGDVKVANFGFLNGGRIAAFDWALAAAAPVSFELGWYLAVNGSRLARSRDDVIAHYRDRLELALGQSLPEDLWLRLHRVAVLAGASMLLWSKALNLESGAPGASEEWAWWVDHLERIAAA
jgi:hypothetical protein